MHTMRSENTVRRAATAHWFKAAMGHIRVTLQGDLLKLCEDIEQRQTFASQLAKLLLTTHHIHCRK